MSSASRALFYWARAVALKHKRVAMLVPFRVLLRVVELLLLLPLRILQLLFNTLAFNPKLGVLRYLFGAGLTYAVFAIALVYVLAPIRGEIGHHTLGPKLHYDAERWLATAIYDGRGSFIGTFDPRLDSLRDVNFTGEAIDFGAYVANPDHKSIPVRQVPESFWQCIVYHEDRNIGGLLNPFGIDLPGVLKIPFSTVRRSIAARRPVMGVGGSTLAMQFVRVIYKTPPHGNEGAFIKLKRKLSEWWLAPVVYRELTANGDDTGLRQWAANHLWLAQRTGGSPLHGIEVTSRIVFGKEAADLTVAEQFVLASAVNRPIILLEGSERLNAVRLDRWRYIIEVRARTCAEKLITDEALQKEVLFELVAMASGPPDPQIRPRLHRALEAHAPTLANVAQANPVIRANALLPSARYGIREEMKQRYGFSWREHVRGVTTTLDAARNLNFRDDTRATLSAINRRYADRIAPGYTLDPATGDAALRSPGVIIAAANARGEIVRYYEQGDNAAYFGSPFARRADDGHYDASRESRMVASTGKILAAIAIANTLRDTPQSIYVDPRAPATGLDTCARGNERQGRSALVSFACSLNEPLLTRAAQIGQARMKRLIDGFGFAMPPANANGEGTPPSTAAVLGQIAGAPRRVHHLAGAVLASLTGQGGRPLPQPTLIKTYDFTPTEAAPPDDLTVVPNRLIRADGRSTLRALLEAPLCHQSGGRAAGTLKELSHWCARRRAGVKLHFAKTGTQVTEDRDATVDAWVAGGVQFSNGAAYSYVVVVGTGSGSQPWARKLHASQVAAPLVDALLSDLEAEATGRRKKPAVDKRSAGAAAAAAARPRVVPPPIQRAAAARITPH